MKGLVDSLIGCNSEFFIKCFIEAFESSSEETKRRGGNGPQEGRRKNISLVDMLTLFILYFTGTATQKALLFFSLIQSFDPFPMKETETVGLLETKDLIHQIYEFLGVPIPFHQVSDSVDLALYGEVPSIIEAILSTATLKTDDPSSMENYDITSLFGEISIVNLHFGSTRSILLSCEQLAESIRVYYHDVSQVHPFNSTTKLIIRYSYQGKRLEKIIPVDYNVLNAMLESQKKNEGQNAFYFYDNIDTSDGRLKQKRQEETNQGGDFRKMRELGDLLSSPMIEVTLQSLSERISQGSFLFILQSLPVVNWALNSGMGRNDAKKCILTLERAENQKKKKLLITGFVGERPLYRATVEIKEKSSVPLERLPILKAEEISKLNDKESNFVPKNERHEPLELMELIRPIEYPEMGTVGNLVELTEFFMMAFCQEHYESDEAFMEFFRKEFQIPEIDLKEFSIKLFDEDGEITKINQFDSLLNVLQVKSRGQMELRVIYRINRQRPRPPTGSISNLVYFKKNMTSQRNGFQRGELVCKVDLDNKSKNLPEIFIVKNTTGDNGKPIECPIMVFRCRGK